MEFNLIFVFFFSSLYPFRDDNLTRFFLIELSASRERALSMQMVVFDIRVYNYYYCLALFI